MLDVLAHPRLRDTTSAKNLHGVPRDVLRGPRDVHLEQTYRSVYRKVISAPLVAEDPTESRTYPASSCACCL